MNIKHLPTIAVIGGLLFATGCVEPYRAYGGGMPIGSSYYSPRPVVAPYPVFRAAPVPMMRGYGGERGGMGGERGDRDFGHYRSHER